MGCICRRAPGTSLKTVPPVYIVHTMHATLTRQPQSEKPNSCKKKKSATQRNLRCAAAGWVTNLRTGLIPAEEPTPHTSEERHGRGGLSCQAIFITFFFCRPGSLHRWSLSTVVRGDELADCREARSGRHQYSERRFPSRNSTQHVKPSHVIVILKSGRIRLLVNFRRTMPKEASLRRLFFFFFSSFSRLLLHTHTRIDLFFFFFFERDCKLPLYNP